MNNLSDKDIRDFNDNLVTLNKRMGSMWLAFGKGVLGGLGSVLGAGIALILIGWFLNVIGVIPALRQQADEWRQVFEQTQSASSIIAPSGATGVTE